MSKFPSQEMDRFNVRLPAGMRDAIAERAKANGRSMNSEIVQILQDALEEQEIEKMEFEENYGNDLNPEEKKALIAQLNEAKDSLMNVMRLMDKNRSRKPT